MIDVKMAIVGPIQTNVYLLKDVETGKLAVVDPGWENKAIDKYIDENGGTLEYIILTHGHYDHIAYAKALGEKYGAKIVGGKYTDDFLTDNHLNHSAYHGDFMKPLEPFKCDVRLCDGDKFRLGNTEITYLSTPGHTKDSGIYIFDDVIIAGDTLFRESYGRTDLPTGNDDEMMNSLRRIKNLSGDYNVFSGHGMTSTLEHERKYNPLMRML